MFNVLHLSSSTYEHDDRDVEEESNGSVDEESEETNVVDLVHAELGALDDNGSNTVHDSATGSVVIERDNRVHLEFTAGEETLNHGKTSGLADDTEHAEDEADEDKLDLANRGDNDTDDNGSDIGKGLEGRGSNAESPGSEESCNGGGGLRVFQLVVLPSLR